MSYQSPFSTRYGSAEMRALWSETAKRRLWRRVWLSVAESMAGAGLVTGEQVDDLRAHVEDIDLKRAAEIEAEIKHDLMAELRVYTEQCPLGGGVLHWGLTSADVQDNAEVVRQKAGLNLLLTALRRLLLAFADQIERTHDLAMMGYTHLQPAEPTTLGYRLSLYAQDVWGHLEKLARLHRRLRGKGIRGAVGTSGPLVDLLQGSEVTPEMLEASVMQSLGLQPFAITAQTYPRIQDYELLSALAGLAASLHKFAFDLRLMQSPGFRIASEPFGESQVGSSAMPFKRNPISAEKINSLARLVLAAADIAWENAASSLLERTLDDSANRRSILPEAFLACDEMLRTAAEIVEGLQIDKRQAKQALVRFGPFAALERLLTALVKEGAPRQEVHERLRQYSQTAWKAVESGKPNPLAKALAKDTTILKYLRPAQVKSFMKAEAYTGLASQRAQTYAEALRAKLSEGSA